MPRDNETARDRLRKITLLQWGLFCLLGAGFAAVAAFGLAPADGGAEAAGRAAGVVVFVVIGLVLIVLHFVRPKKGRAKASAQPKPAGRRPRQNGGGSPGAPPRRKRPKP